MVALCSSGTWTSTILAVTAVRWWPTPPSSHSSSQLTCKLLVSLVQSQAAPLTSLLLLRFTWWEAADHGDQGEISDRWEPGGALYLLAVPPSCQPVLVHQRGEGNFLFPHSEFTLGMFPGQRWLLEASEDPRGIRRHFHLRARSPVRDLPPPLQGRRDQTEVQLQSPHHLLAEQHGECQWETEEVKLRFPAQVELHEASPRLGRVMGIAGGQTEPATSGPEISEEEIIDKEEAAQKARAEDEVAVGQVGLAAGKHWPVASRATASLITFSLLFFLSAGGTFVNIL